MKYILFGHKTIYCYAVVVVVVVVVLDAAIKTPGNVDPITQVVYISQEIRIYCYSSTTPKWEKDGRRIDNPNVNIGSSMGKYKYYLKVSRTTELDSGTYTCHGKRDEPSVSFSASAQVFVGGNIIT